MLPQLMAAKGWIVFSPNYRGSDNLGNAYALAIVNDAGEGPGRDVMAGVTELRLKASRVGTTITCSRGTRVVSATLGSTGTAVGVRTRSASVQFHSVLVYRLGGALP